MEPVKAYTAWGALEAYHTSDENPAPKPDEETTSEEEEVTTDGDQPGSAG